MRTTFACLALVAAAALVMAATATAQFPNKDTAKDRQDSSWGTRPEGDSGVYMDKGEDGSDSWGTRPGEKAEQPDPYEDIIITVNPDVKWPPSGSETTTTSTEHTTANASQDANSTDTTTTTTTW